MNSSIEALNHWGENFLNFAWPMLWQSSLLIVVLFVFDYLFQRKIRASIRYALWLVVLVKLCVPPTLALPTSPVWWLHQTPPPVAAKAKPHYTVTYDNGSLPETPQSPLPAFDPPKPRLTNAAWLLTASVTVGGFLLGWLLVRWRQITRHVRRAKISARLTVLAGEAQTVAGTKSKVRVKLITNSMSPAVCGLFRPAILIPQSLVDHFSDGQLRAVLLHELIHLRRRDVWLNFGQALLQIFYWWHPLVWLANARIRRVREEAVDDAVMLTLRDDAESYASTLLEVAKLALNRPLPSLGLVGIMESRHSLRQRIERLVDFRPPRKAGLTLASLIGILTFTAVAVPMGNAPDKPGDSSGSDGLQTLTVNVNPEIFLRNVKAHAGYYLHATNEDYTIILTDILRGEGVDNIPPHAFVFNIGAGEMTARNSPDALEIFRQIIEQLNRADGKAVLFLPDSSYHRAFHSESILIDAQFYAMPIAQYKQAIGILDNVSYVPGNFGIGLVPANRFAEFNKKIESLDLRPFNKPRVETGHGITASLFCGTATNGVHFDCLPYIGGKGVDLAFHASVDGDFSADGTTLVGIANHAISGRATVENYGGIIVCANNPDGSVKNNLVVVMEVQIVTNNPPVKARASAVDKKMEAGILVQDAKLDYEMGKMDESEAKLKAALVLDSENPAAKYYLGLVQAARQRQNVIKPSEGRQEIIRKLLTIRLDSLSFEALPLSEVVRTLHEESKKVDPNHRGINFMINPNLDQSGPPTIDPLTGLPTTNSAVIDSGLIDIPITIYPPMTNISLGDVLDALVLVASEPIHYTVEDYAIVFSPGKPLPVLYSRHFRVDANEFMATMQKVSGIKTTNIPAMAKDFFKTLGVDLDLPGKSVFYGDRLGELFVRATAQDLDTIQLALEAVTATAPQIHIKARFLEVPKGTLNGLKSIISVTNQLVQTNQLAGLVGILSDENLRTVLHTLEALPGAETWAEPEVVTTSGRQTQMRATTTIVREDVVFDVVVQRPVKSLEVGPSLDVIPYVLSDGYTINLTLIPSLTELLVSSNSFPKLLPDFRVRQVVTTLNLWDNQTAIISGLPEKDYANGKEAFDKSKSSDKQFLIFITATIVDPAGNRIHSDDDLPFAKVGVPSQPQSAR